MNTILQSSTPYSKPSPSNSDLFNRRRLCHLANKLKHIATKRAAEISTSGNAIVSMIHGVDRILVSNSRAS